MPDVTRTRAELVNKAASKLQIVGSGQSLDADDSAVLDDAIDPLLAQLAQDGVVDVDADEIPVEYFDPLASLLANACSGDFGQPFSEEVRRTFEAQLRRTSTGGATYEVQRATYF